ncbi:hypothetical protein HDU91_002265 [Kappamyces sp. JEL0680]|nr:hypothetical protein HDU91_002265 [Kappamyces sp. JEL0680]
MVSLDELCLALQPATEAEKLAYVCNVETLWKIHHHSKYNGWWVGFRPGREEFQLTRRESERAHFQIVAWGGNYVIRVVGGGIRHGKYLTLKRERFAVSLRMRLGLSDIAGAQQFGLACDESLSKMKLSVIRKQSDPTFLTVGSLDLREQLTECSRDDGLFIEMVVCSPVTTVVKDTNVGVLSEVDTLKTAEMKISAGTKYTYVKKHTKVNHIMHVASQDTKTTTTSGTTFAPEIAVAGITVRLGDLLSRTKASVAESSNAATNESTNTLEDSDQFEFGGINSPEVFLRFETKVESRFVQWELFGIFTLPFPIGNPPTLVQKKKICNGFSILKFEYEQVKTIDSMTNPAAIVDQIIVHARNKVSYH